MLFVLSPSKTLDYETPPRTDQHTSPDFLKESKLLINELKTYSSEDLATLMKVSQSIADLNVERYGKWKAPFTLQNAKQAILAFKGDVYTGLKAETFNAKDDVFAQKYLRILSGLYGVLRPLDLIQAYRLEMGSKLPNQRGKNLYAFWSDLITEKLNKDLKSSKSKHLTNLASNEYFKVIKPKLLNAEIITPVFKDKKSGTYKIIAFFAKKARGNMARYIIKNKVLNPNDLKNFADNGYRYDAKSSTEHQLVFLRDDDLLN
jgi:uncharacterized protein